VAVSWNEGSVPKKMAPILPMQSASRFCHRAGRGLQIDRREDLTVPASSLVSWHKRTKVSGADSNPIPSFLSDVRSRRGDRRLNSGSGSLPIRQLAIPLTELIELVFSQMFNMNQFIAGVLGSED
jgi:hypothetical protein